MKIKMRETLLSFFWMGAVFSYFFQFPISRLSKLIVPFLGLFIAGAIITGKRHSIKGNWGKIYIIYLAYLMLMTLLSAMDGVEIGGILRFLLILVMIPLFCVVNTGDFSLEKKIFIILAVLKCFLLLYYALAMYRAGSYVEYRQWARENNFGDMYINPSTHLPSVMVQGNGILPIAFFLNLEDKKGSRMMRNAFTVILAIGMIVAGNMAFLLAIAVYFGIKLLKIISSSNLSKTKQVLLSTLLIIAVCGFMPIGIRILSMKADWSNAIRIQQAQVLLNNNVIIGNGIGHKIYATTEFRVYAGDTYFELQTLYIYNQIGLTGLIMFYYLIFSPFRDKPRTNLYIFIAYIVYSFLNPYCFDTTEMIVLSLLIHYPLYRKAEDRTLLFHPEMLFVRS